MKPSTRGRLVLLVLVVCAGVLGACGKKGPPLPPLARIPSPPGNLQAFRAGDDVYLAFDVPAANVSGETPADLSAIEVYAATAATAPPGPDPTRSAVKIGTYAVVPPMPPPSPPREGEPAVPVPPGFVQGTRAVVRETLTPDVLVPTPVSGPGAGRAPRAEEPDARLRPVLSPSAESGLMRFYFLVAQGTRGRSSTPTAIVAVPLQDATSPPTDLRLDYTPQAITLTWTPPADARVAPAPPADPSLLPSKPLTPPPPATTYHVFETPRTPPPAGDPFQLTLPAPLTPQPVAGTELAIPGAVRFGMERCFVVRSVDTIAGAITLGRPSAPGCITPADTFPPAPPQRLAAIAGVGVINLIWEPNTEPDLAGYIVLRGAAPGDTLQAITPAPIRDTTYRDESVRPGERYVYAVVAVDTAVPQNVSGQSNRVEEASRVPR